MSKPKSERGPYYLVFGSTPEELEQNINELLGEWKYWQFMKCWQVDEAIYREMIKLPGPRHVGEDTSIVFLEMPATEYDA